MVTDPDQAHTLLLDLEASKVLSGNTSSFPLVMLSACDLQSTVSFLKTDPHHLYDQLLDIRYAPGGGLCGTLFYLLCSLPFKGKLFLEVRVQGPVASLSGLFLSAIPLEQSAMTQSALEGKPQKNLSFLGHPDLRQLRLPQSTCP